MREKTVLFVGGTSYSGSTMLDLILANDPQGFSCGEVVNLFYPSRPFHASPICGCGDPNCTVWREVRRAGPDRLYTTIFAMFPHVSLIVDSSKDVCWIRRQQKVLGRQGIAVRNVLIWKKPDTMQKSFAKRGKAETFESIYVDYHAFYNASAKEWVGICYDEMVTQPQLLGDLCERIGLEMFDGKQEYWNRKQHVLFGNHAAKIHMYEPDHPLYRRAEQRLHKEAGKLPTQIEHYRSIHATSVEAASPQGGLQPDRANVGRRATAVGSFLQSKSVGHPHTETATATDAGWLDIGTVACVARCGAYWISRAARGLKFRRASSSSQS